MRSGIKSLLLILLWCIRASRGDISKSTGIVYGPSGIAIHRSRVTGTTNLIIPKYPRIESDGCVDEVIQEMTTVTDELFPQRSSPVDSRSSAKRKKRFIGIGIASGAAIAAGVAIGKANEAYNLAHETAKRVDVVEENLDILEAAVNDNREAIRLQQEIDDQIILQITELENYINNELVKELSDLDCAIRKNEVRSKWNTALVSMTTKYANIIDGGRRMVYSEYIRMEVANTFDAVALAALGTSKDRLMAGQDSVRASVRDIGAHFINLAVQVVRNDLISNVDAYDARSVAVLSDGYYSRVHVPQVLVKAEDRYFSLGDTCEKTRAQILCFGGTLGAEVDLDCGGGCTWERSTRVDTVISSGEDGVLVNCDAVACLCDGNKPSGVQLFPLGSCAELSLDGEVFTSGSVEPGVTFETIEIDVKPPLALDPIVLDTDISELQSKITDLVAEDVELKDHYKQEIPPGKVGTTYAIAIVALIIAIVALGVSGYMIFKMRSLSKGAEIGNGLFSARGGGGGGGTAGFPKDIPVSSM